MTRSRLRSRTALADAHLFGMAPGVVVATRGLSACAVPVRIIGRGRFSFTAPVPGGEHYVHH